MSEKSIINIKSTEIAERTHDLNHTIGPGKSLVISERDKDGKLKVIIDITAGLNYDITIKATIEDRKRI